MATTDEKNKATEREDRITVIASHVQAILETIDEHDREGLEKTPERVARYYVDELYCSGNALEEELNTVFVEETTAREMITVMNIPFSSMCEHHLLPYFGRVHIAYIPHKGVVGLSKLARLAQAAGRGFSIQERVTDRIADALNNKLSPAGVIVVIDCVHTCMIVRGVHAIGSRTVTSALRGVFRDSEAARTEFYAVLNGSKNCGL